MARDKTNRREVFAIFFTAILSVAAIIAWASMGERLVQHRFHGVALILLVFAMARTAKPGNALPLVGLTVASLIWALILGSKAGATNPSITWLVTGWYCMGIVMALGIGKIFVKLTHIGILPTD